jgi:hypothetical protein
MIVPILTRLMEQGDRVEISFTNGTMRRGYIRSLQPGHRCLRLSLRPDSASWNWRWYAYDNIASIRGTRKTRRTKEYPVFYEALPYVATETGALDMEKTLRGLLMFA